MPRGSSTSPPTKSILFYQQLIKGLIFRPIFSIIYIDMNIRTYNLSMLAATIIAWLGFFVVIASFDPKTGNSLIFIMFYALLFLSVLGTLSLLGFLIRLFWNRKRGTPRVMALESFRQAIIFAAVLAIALCLQAARVLTWWNMLLLVILATAVEFVTLLFHQNNSDKSNI